jgi:hypothetical protein
MDAGRRLPTLPREQPAAGSHSVKQCGPAALSTYFKDTFRYTEYRPYDS